MKSAAPVRQPDLDQPDRPIRKRRKVIRRAGWMAAGVALAILVTGRATGEPVRHAQAPGCMTAAAAQANGKQFPAEPPMTIDPAAKYTAALETNCGTIDIALDTHAPRTVNSFDFLSGQQYFDHTKCHRLTTDGIFVLQCGDPTGSGRGGPGYQFPDENLAGATYHAGTVAMANSGPNTNGSQFFLVYKDSPLPPNYTPFGHITQGMDVLQNVAAGGAKGGAPDGPPANDVVLQSVNTTKG